MKKLKGSHVEDFNDENIDKPSIVSNAKLVPYIPTPGVMIALDNFVKNVSDAIAVNQDDWPKGRTLELSLEFAIVPMSFNAKFGQN